MTSASAHGALAVSILRGEEGRQAREVEKLARLLARDPPDVVCLSNAMLIGLARSVKSATGARVICTLQGEIPYLDALRAPHGEEAWSEIGRRAADVDRFVAVSRWYGEAFAQRAALGAERLRVVHNGIELDGFAQAPDEKADRPRTLGYLARLCEEKGLPQIVEAFCSIAARRGFEDVRLCAVGAALPPDGSLLRRLSKRVAAAGLADRASFHPNVDREEKLALLRSFTVMSVPATYGESFGLYVLEALAAGVPVVQPSHGAFPELLEATGGGIICPPDDAAALADAVADLLADPARARALGERGRLSVLDRFGARHMARAFLDICSEIAGDHACRTSTR
jgi:glycosyltransferase involved in cell wall biosynthesis